MYIVGIDIGKRNHEASIMNAAGKQYGKPIRFANSHTGFNKLMDWVKNISGADDVVFGMKLPGTTGWRFTPICVMRGTPSM